MALRKEAKLKGLDVAKRGKALEENAEIVRILCRGESLNYQRQGQIYNMTRTKPGYLPAQRVPPIWIAAEVYDPTKQNSLGDPETVVNLWRHR